MDSDRLRPSKSSAPGPTGTDPAAAQHGAEDDLARLINEAGTSPDRRVDLANHFAQHGRVDEALAQLDEVLRTSPRHARALHNKGLLLNQLGQPDAAIACLSQATQSAPDDPVFANNFAVVLSDAGHRDAALLEFERALRLYPGNIHIEHQIRRLRSELVPFWHIPMLNDRPRNDAFEAAIKAVIAARGPGALVLDIGTGSGLLAMMAVRAGAEQAVACEVVPVIARTSQAIVAGNGLADRIVVHARQSTDLEVGTHLPRRADILVSEILSSDLLTEKVLDTFEDAYRRLLADDAVVVPRSATAVGCLVASSTLSDYVHVGTVSGFDVSPFNDLGPTKLPIHGTMTNWQRLSDDIDLVTVDLRQRVHGSALDHLAIRATADGEAIGIVQWMRIDLAEGIAFTNHPDDYRDGGWLQVLHRFTRPIPVKAGQTLDMAVGHDRTTLIITPFVPQQ